MDTESAALVDRIVVGVGHFVTALCLALGILASLHTRLGDTTQLTVFTVSPSAALTWLAIGLVGGPMVVGPARARLYLTIVGVALVAWGVTAIALDGSGAAMFTRDVPLVALVLATGVLSLGAAVAGAALTRPTIETSARSQA